MSEPQPRRFQFDEQLAMSHGHSASADIEKLLLEQIPGARNARPAAPENDRQGTDWWVEHVSGRHLSVDCKVRSEDWSVKSPPRDDLAIETWSVIEKQKPGWSRDQNKRSDYILWLWTDTGRWCLVPFHMLCAVTQEHWQRWISAYGANRQDTEGRYHSECVFVPRRELWVCIFRRFGGSAGHRVTSSTVQARDIQWR